MGDLLHDFVRLHPVLVDVAWATLLITTGFGLGLRVTHEH